MVKEYLNSSPEELLAKNKAQKQFWDMITYYVLIGIVSIMSLTILPMIGSELPLSLLLPQTFAGWVVYIVTKLLVASVNMLLFYCFMEQGKTNVKHHWHHVLANEILHRLKKINIVPRSPEIWKKGEYQYKGTTIAITTILSAIALGQAILSFDWIAFISYFFTLFMGLVFGLLQMKKSECYWAEEYYDYALYEMNIYNNTVTDEKEIMSVDEYNYTILKGGEVIYDYNKQYRIPQPDRASTEEQGRHSETL